MLGRLRERVTYANTTATIALIVALGGTSYAALTLPRDSVGHRQLQPGAVRAREVKDGSLGTKELSAHARRALRGPVGPIGPAGAQGPAAAEYFAVLNATGERVAGNATGVVASGGGSYTVSFSRSAAGCAATATLGTTDATTTVPGRITVNVVNGQVGVQTFASDGAPASLPFHLIVAC
jgi:hypothetical protein